MDQKLDPFTITAVAVNNRVGFRDFIQFIEECFPDLNSRHLFSMEYHRMFVYVGENRVRIYKQGDVYNSPSGEFLPVDAPGLFPALAIREITFVGEVTTE